MNCLKDVAGRFLAGCTRGSKAVLFILSLLLPSFAVATPNGQSQYLPLSVGQKWVLRSSVVKDPIVLEVIGERSGSFDMRFDNPWIPSTLRIRPDGDRYSLEALVVNGQTKNMPPGTVYWDFSANRGQSWQNAIGKLDVVSRDQHVKAVQQTFDNCIQFQETTHESKKVIWTFAPGVGFVQFGEGAWAFVLDRGASRANTGGSQPRVTIPTSTRPAPHTGNLLIGLSANPFAGESLTPTSVRKHFEQSLSGGVNYIYLSPKWNELERSPGKYEFADLDFQIGQSVEYRVPAILNVRIIDTASRAFPADLENKSTGDSLVLERLLKLLTAISPHLRGRVKYMMIGNEIDAYFTHHSNEVAAYAELFRAGSQKMKQLVPGIQVSTTITFDGVSQTDSLLKPLVKESDFFSATYYPMQADFTVRDPGGVARDMAKVIGAAGGKPILLQEVGCPSSPLNNSSEDKQSLVFSNVLDELASHRTQFIGANFFLMSDLSDSVVNTLAQYYKMPNADRFKSFLKTLGMFDSQGHPKKSWNMFREKAPAVSKM